MRLFLLTFALAAGLQSPAAADQTDPRLDPLFEELRAGGPADAEALVRQIVGIWSDSQSDTVDLLFARAEESLESEKIELAIALLDHAIGLSPSFAQAYALRGAARLASDDTAGAIGDFTRTIELEPRQFEARIALAEILLAGGDRAAASSMLQKALEWNPHEEYARERARKLRDELDGQEI